jgi:hypothetical protein
MLTSVNKAVLLLINKTKTWMIKKYRNLFAHPLLPYAVTLVETPNSKLQTPNSKTPVDTKP